MADLSRYYEKAEKHLQKGKQEAALEAYLAALNDDPRDERAREAAADLCLTLNQPVRAAEFYSGLMREYIGKGNLAKALPAFKKLVRTGRYNLDVLLEYAEACSRANKKEAIEAFEVALKSYQSHGKFADALAVMDRIVALDPRPETFRRQGELAAQAGKKEAAAAAFVKVASAALRAGFDPSEPYERAFQLDPTNLAAALGHGRCLVTQGRHEEAIHLLKPLANYPSAPMEAREPYALALLAAGRMVEAEAFVWELFERDPQSHLKTIIEVISGLLESGKSQNAVDLARKLNTFQRKAGKLREFVPQMKELADWYVRDTALLEFMAELYNSTNRETDYCRTLIQLFDLRFAEGDFIKAADALDRAVEVDAYEAGHHERLESLQGKVDSERLSAISTRLGIAPVAEAPATEESKDEPTVLEDLVLQAEIFLQYSMKPKALERIQRIEKLFPGVHETEERVRELFAAAGYVSTSTAPSVPQQPPPTPQVELPPPPRMRETQDMDDLTLASEVNRNIARQASVKSVLSTAVNDVGRNWKANRCVAGLCSPGKPPAAVLEYCAPGVKQSEVTAVVKLIMGLQAACEPGHKVLATSDVRSAPELLALAPIFASRNVESLLAIPLLDRDEPVGILILEQQATRREWRTAEIAVMRSIADQVVMAVNSARLRSLVKTLAVTDEGSGLLKRASYIDVLLSEVQRAKQQKAPLTILLMNFGKSSAMTKEFGEPAVEKMMQHAGQMITTHIRQNDVAIRYGLTEIALVLADTNHQNAVMAAEKLRKVLQQVRLPGKESAPEFTAGVAEALLAPEFDAVDIVTEVINRAESALQSALAEKKGGTHVAAAQYSRVF